MTNIFEAYEITKKLSECLASARFIYGEKWDELKNETLEIIKKHHEEHKTKSLLWSAIKLAGEKEAKEQLVILAAIADYLANNK